MKRWLFICTALLFGCDGEPWNNPYPHKEQHTNTLYSAFADQPRHLDPAKSYIVDEWQLLGNILVPPLQYDYLKRPVTVIPFGATQLPDTVFFNEAGQVVSEQASNIAKTLYTITLRQDMFYQDHVMFKEEQGAQTRRVTADDYIYQIKRLADLQNECPIYAVLKEKIIGFESFSEQAKKLHDQNTSSAFVDLRSLNLAGVKKVDDFTFQIVINGTFPALKYWLTTPFFAPIPWEAERYYSDPTLIAKNITLNYFPIGSGPYQLTENNPHRRMILERNPHFFEERFPDSSAEKEADAFLPYINQRMPFVDKVVFSLEQESVPLWAKFLQGYYDRSGITSDNFDSVLSMQSDGQFALSDTMKQKEIRLHQAVQPTLFYFAFNDRDPIYGGRSERATKLRQAIAIAFDMEEYLTLFRNGRGVVAQGVIPPGIVGAFSDDVYDPIVYEKQAGRLVRKPLEHALELLKEAGYPDGIDLKTGQPLKAYFDVNAGGADDQALLDWMRVQFNKLHIELVVRATTPNQLMQKLDDGSVQFFLLGWHLDYPDAENMLSTFSSEHARITKRGENTINYMNAHFDALLKQIENKVESNDRLKAIQDAQMILMKDKVLIGAFYPTDVTLIHKWYGPLKSHEFANNTLKYISLDPALRVQKRKEWNQPWLFF